MENKRTHPFVTIHCDIVEETETSSGSDATINLATLTQQSPSLTPTANREETTGRLQSSSPNEEVSTHIFKSIQTQSTQETTRARQLRDEKIAVVELTNNKLTMQYTLESLRMHLKKHIPNPIPSGDKYILNKRHKNLTLLHESVIFRKHDITELPLEHGADVNIYVQGQKIAHRAAAANDISMLYIIHRHGGDFSLLDHHGKTALMIAVSLRNTEAVKEILNYRNKDIFSTNNETILHYAARHDDPEVARYACDPKHGIKLNQRSTHELRTALHIAVKESRVEITNILLENGARDEWGDIFGAYARDYIRDDEIGVLFLKNGFSLNYNYTKKSYEQKELRGKFISSATTTLPLITGESEAGPTESKRPRIVTDAVIEQDIQPGPSRFK
jgi:hypothetical protein